MAKIQFHKFNPIIYPLKLWIAKSPTNEAVKELFEEHDGTPITDNFRSTAIASTYKRIVSNKGTNEYGIFIAIHSNVTAGIIAHEATHAARFMWDWLQEYEPAVEADAYLVGWVADCMWQVKTGKFKG